MASRTEGNRADEPPREPSGGAGDRDPRKAAGRPPPAGNTPEASRQSLAALAPSPTPVMLAVALHCGYRKITLIGIQAL